MNVIQWKIVTKSTASLLALTVLSACGGMRAGAVGNQSGNFSSGVATANSSTKAAKPTATEVWWNTLWGVDEAPKPKAKPAAVKPVAAKPTTTLAVASATPIAQPATTTPVAAAPAVAPKPVAAPVVVKPVVVAKPATPAPAPVVAAPAPAPAPVAPALTPEERAAAEAANNVDMTNVPAITGKVPLPKPRPSFEALTTPAIPPLMFSKAAPWANIRGSESWTRTALAMIRLRLPYLEKAKDVNDFCPGYSAASSDLREVCWLRLIGAVVQLESAYKAESSFVEPNGAASVGLMALSPRECKNAPREVDLKNAVRNLTCGIDMMARLIARDGYIAGRPPRRGASQYWSTLRTPYETNGYHVGKKAIVTALTKKFKSFLQFAPPPPKPEAAAPAPAPVAPAAAAPVAPTAPAAATAAPVATPAAPTAAEAPVVQPAAPAAAVVAPVEAQVAPAPQASAAPAVMNDPVSVNN